MDLDRMLEKCLAGQWRVRALDFSRPPRPLSRAHERAVVQYFVDMAGIERLAGALFAAQREKVADPVLAAILDTFVADEKRHAQVAMLLADHFDVHHDQVYQQSPALTAFTPHFVRAIRYLSEDIAAAYITAGELILDVALLRSLGDFVADDTTNDALRLVNRDESRHIAIDYHMTEYYASDAFVAELARREEPPLATRLAAWKSFVLFLHHARAFFRDVFFGPMDLVDPTGKRLREAFKRIQLLAAKPEVRRRPFARFMSTVFELYNRPLARRAVGPALLKLSGVDPRVLDRLYDREEERHAVTASFDALAAEALAAKHAS